jgi:hypothetical protein
MDIDVFPPHELPTVMRVLRTALEPTDSLWTRERAFLDTYAHIVGFELPIDTPEPIGAADVHIDSPHARKRLVQLVALAVLLNRPVKRAAFEFLKALAGQLAVRDGVIAVIEALLAQRHVLVRLLVMRRVMRVMLKEALAAEGPMGIVRLFAAMFFKAAVNKDEVWKYKRLGLLPEGTLGREYWKHMTTVGFGFPGEPAGIVASVAYHDVAHVMAENEPTPSGEIQQGSFQGGNRREDGFFFIQFVILHFHHGVRITPGAPPEAGHYDPEAVLWAIHRGAKCSVDMTHQWDFWPLMALPIDEARAACNLLPLRA